MRKVISIIIICLCVNFTIPLMAKHAESEQAEQVPIRRKLINPNAQTPLPKLPSVPIYIFKDGNTLLCGSYFDICVVTLISKEDINVFSRVTDTNGTIILPDYLEGTFELCINKDGVLYTGFIDL